MVDTGGTAGSRPRVPVDLAAPPSDPFDDVAVPAGWADVAELARGVSHELEDLAERVLARVRIDIPAYQPPAPVPDADFRASVTNNLRVLLLCLAEQRFPDADEIAVRRELGARRALQGLPIDAVLAAYQVGYHELWETLVAAIPDATADETSRKLLSAATTVWGSVQAISDAIATSHASTSRRLEARRIGARQRFVELLATAASGREATRLARSLGFDPAGTFRVALVTTGPDQADAVDLQRHVERIEGHHAVVVRGSRQVVVSQGSTPEELLRAARDAAPSATVATGAQRHGLAGAAASLADAERTLAVVGPGEAATFEEEWLWASLTGADARLGEVLHRGAETARSHPHLAAAVTAFADHRFSVTDAARHLSLHANTVKYRLDRWEELTGWDPRSFTGLARSLASIRLG